MIYIFDKNLSLINTMKSELISAIMKRRLIGVDQLFIEAHSGAFDKLKDASYLGHFYKQKFYIYTIKKTVTNNNRITIDAVNYAYDELAGKTIIEDKRPTNVTAQVAMTTALLNTGYTLGVIQTTPVKSTNFYYISPLEAIKKIIEVWGIEPDFYFEFDGNNITGRKVDLYFKRGTVTGERYTYGSNLIDILYEENRNDIVTAIYGRGKGVEILDAKGNPTGTYGRRLTFESVTWDTANGDPVNKPVNQGYIELPQMTALYGYPNNGGPLLPRYGVLILDQETDANNLISETYKTLVERSRPILTLGSTVAKAGPYELGDTNYIIRPDLNIMYEGRIFEDEVDLLNPARTKFKFGDYIPSKQAQTRREMKEYFNGLTDKIAQTEQDIKSNIIKVSNDWYTALNEQKTGGFMDGDSYDYMLQAGNPYNLPAGIYSFNQPLDDDPATPEPTSALVIRNGMLGRANILENGTWDFNLFGDGSGLTADAITAGKIKAQFVEIGAESVFMEGYNPIEKASITYVDTQLNVMDGIISLMASRDELTAVSDRTTAVELVVTPEAITNTVTQSSKYIDDLSAISNAIESKAEELSNQFTTDISGFNNTWSASITDLEDNISLMKTYLRWDAPSATLSLGGNSSPFSTELSPQMLAFLESGNVVAYIKNSQLLIKEAVILEGLTYANHKTIKYGDKVSIDLWTGGKY